MSNFKTQEITEMFKIFHLKLLTEKILEFLNATKVITSMIISFTYKRSKIVPFRYRRMRRTTAY